MAAGQNQSGNGACPDRDRRAAGGLCSGRTCAPTAASVAAVLTDDRPAIPATIKRAVGQRCAFGCVICGLPLYEYDHLIPYSEVEEHHPGNIVLLCDRHHAEKTKGLLPMQAITAVSKAPANARAGVSAAYSLHYSEQACEARIGSNVYVWPVLRDGMMTGPLIVDDTPVVMFRMEDGHLLLTAQLLTRTTRCWFRFSTTSSATQWSHGTSSSRDSS